MKIRLLLATLVCAVMTVPGLRAEDARKEAETELGAKMEKMGGAFRKLRRQVADASKNQDSLAQVAIIRENATAALKLEPAKKADLPAADQAKFVAAYRVEMKEFISLAGKLETALKAGNNEEAAKLCSAMGDEQKKGHKEFQKKKERK